MPRISCIFARETERTSPRLKHHHIISSLPSSHRLLRSAQLSEIVEHNPSECSNFESLIEEAIKQYRDATWRDVLTNLAVEPVSGTLSKKERDAIKEKYTAFNEAFESILATQRELSIPSRVCPSMDLEQVALLVESETAVSHLFSPSVLFSRLPVQDICDRLRQNNIALIKPAFTQFNEVSYVPPRVVVCKRKHSTHLIFLVLRHTLTYATSHPRRMPSRALARKIHKST